jgi:ElaB/YqjD/DUF883 family membrane-anchored ribosome-binding protein
MTHVTGDAAGRRELIDQASEQVQGVASAAQEKASEVREQGSARLRDQFDERSSQAGSQVRLLASALRRGAADLSGDGNANASHLTTQAADRIERLGSYLEQKSGDEVMRDIESFARRRPWMLAGLGMLAGVAAARFTKASSEHRYGDDRGPYGQSPTGTGVSEGRPRAGGRTEPGRAGSIDQPLGDVSDARAGSLDDPLARDPYAGRS